MMIITLTTTTTMSLLSTSVDNILADQPDGDQKNAESRVGFQLRLLPFLKSTHIEILFIVHHWVN